MNSRVELIASQPESERQTLLSNLTDADAYALLHDWSMWARPDQMIPESDWNIWLIMAGRGWGKTRVGAETIRQWVNSGEYKLIHLVARTAADARDTMVQGESGILSVCSGDVGNVPEYKSSQRCIEWPNGAKALLFSAEQPDALRGPQCEAWWADELASWQYLESTWDMLQFGARLGNHVRGIVTTTPRPLKQIKDLLKRADVHVTRGTTYDNIANLAASAIIAFKERYEGTRIGRQELYAEILDDVEGALWSREIIERNRLNDNAKDIAKRCKKIVVAVDPSGSRGETGDEIGIVVCGLGERGEGYVLDDRTLLAGPQKWATAAVEAYYDWSADHIVYESNFGGAMCEHTLRTVDKRVPLVEVHASRGKFARAEPIVSLYEQDKVHHVGNLAKLEDEMCTWVNGESDWSPNRMDSVVWALTDLMLGGREIRIW